MNILFLLFATTAAACSDCFCTSYGQMEFHNGSTGADVSAPAYPDFALLPAASFIRDFSFAGNSLLAEPDGFMITETGNYTVGVTAVLFNTADMTSMFTLFGVLDKQFSSTDINLVGSFNSVTPGNVVSFFGQGQMQINRGQTLSAIIANGSGPDPVSIKVMAWGLTVERLSPSSCLQCS